MAAIVAVALVTVAAFGVGRVILRLLGAACATSAEEVAFSVGLGFGAIAYAVFGLGLAGALYPWVLGGLLLTLAALAAVREGSGGRTAVGGTFDEARRGDRLLAVSLGTLLLVAAAANLVAALAPPTGGDALTYHLAVPKLWLQEHRITAIPWRWPSLGPFAVQMLYLLVMALPGDPSPSVLAWMMGIVAAIGLIGAGSKLPRPVPPLLAAGIFYTMSTVGQNAAATRVDLGLAMFVLLATLGCLTYLNTRQVPWLIVAGVCAGLAAGTKQIGAAAAAVLVIGLVAFAPRSDSSLRGGLRAAGLFALVAAGVAAPWYVRSLVLTGDPVYPFLTAVLGNPALRERLGDLTLRYGPGKTPADFALLPLYLTAAIGPPYLSFAPFSLALWRLAQVRFLWFVVAALTVIWFFTAQVIRFLLPALPAAAILAALGFAVLDGRPAALRTAARLVIAAGLATAAAITIYHDAGFARVVAGLESRDAYLLRAIDNHDDTVWMNTHLPGDARVLLLARYGYYLERWYIGAGTAARVDDLHRSLAEHRISHIYCAAERCDQIVAGGVRVEVLRQRPLRGNPGFSRVLRVIGP